MAHMRIETEHGTWILVEVNGETHYVPPGMVSLDGLPKGTTSLESMRRTAEVNGTDPDDASNQWDEWMRQLQDYVGPVITGEDADVEITEREGWGARYSAPGYMDCTDWCLGDTEEEAVKECREVYGDEEEESDDERPVW